MITKFPDIKKRSNHAQELLDAGRINASEWLLTMTDLIRENYQRDIESEQKPPA